MPPDHLFWQVATRSEDSDVDPVATRSRAVQAWRRSCRAASPVFPANGSERAMRAVAAASIVRNGGASDPTAALTASNSCDTGTEESGSNPPCAVVVVAAAERLTARVACGTLSPGAPESCPLQPQQILGPFHSTLAPPVRNSYRFQSTSNSVNPFRTLARPTQPAGCARSGRGIGRRSQLPLSRV